MNGLKRIRGGEQRLSEAVIWLRDRIQRQYAERIQQDVLQYLLLIKSYYNMGQ